MVTEFINTSSPHKSISSLEMGTDYINLICTYGKILIKFEGNVSDVTIGQMLLGISKIDPMTFYEYEILCNYEEIASYKSLGFILASYAKSADKYKVLFNISFNNKTRIYHLSKLIIEKLKTQKFNLDLYWNADDVKIMRLSEELKQIDGWKIKQIIYK